MYELKDWEDIGYGHLYRLKVNTGWLVRYVNCLEKTEGITFVPDAYHTWNVQSKESEGELK